MVTPLVRLASFAVRSYDRISPIARGKHWLRRRTAGFLVAPIGDGLYIRVSGVSGFEWKAFRGVAAESETVAAWRALLRPGMTALDVGANVGYFALLAARAVGPSGHVHAFEATPAVAARLGENVALNRLGNVTVNPSAVSDRAGEVEFRLQTDDSEGNSLVSYASDWPVVRVPAVTLDEYVTDRGLNRVDAVKLDVEGAEGLVLTGAARLLSRPDPPVVIYESNPATLRAAGESPVSLARTLSAYGYRCHPFEKLTAGSDPVWNVLAVHPSHGRDAAVARLVEGRPAL